MVQSHQCSHPGSWLAVRQPMAEAGSWCPTEPFCSGRVGSCRVAKEKASRSAPLCLLFTFPIPSPLIPPGHRAIRVSSGLLIPQGCLPPMLVLKAALPHLSHGLSCGRVMILSFLWCNRGSDIRAGPAKTKPLHTVKGAKVPVVHVGKWMGMGKAVDANFTLHSFQFSYTLIFLLF